ncbi:MAG: helix-turn-helix transcriptional regulator [Chitinispirillaceae bacterium]|nr:helix-turn-helix transcriptional regulator [Chitinispirillaceae bacterium]
MKTSAVIFTAIALLSITIRLNADTISRDSGFLQTSVVPDTSILSKSDSAAAGPETASQKPRVKTGTKNRRDSTLRALLATLEKEDSLNALSQLDTTAALLQKKNPGKKYGVKERWQNLVRTARGHPRPFVVAGVTALIILLLLVALRIAGKKADKRFMTTTRLSLMDSEVRRACVHIEKHFADPALTPGIVCAAVVTGESFLETLFQKELGMNIASYIAQTRVHHAKQMIKENPAVEAPSVAAHSGFADTALFKTAFEKLTGYPFENFPRK